MVLTRILQQRCIKVPVLSRDKQSVITELVDLLNANKLLHDRDVALQSVLAREQTRSTGIGGRIAIPHGKSNAVNDLVVGMGIAHKPIEFDSIDGRPVTIIILLISAIDKTGPHIQALATISRLMLDEEFKQRLEMAGSPQEAYKLLQEKESQQNR
jgi:fructose-specific phosphotransferase system IIA component